MSLWNYTIDDASPYVSYRPYGDGAAPSSGWQTWYTGTGYNSAPEQISRGDSYHITSRNASVTLQFVGTGVALFGITNSSFSITIDNGARTTVSAPITPGSPLYTNYNLTNKPHSLTLTAQPTSTQTLAFDFAIVSTPLHKDESPPSPLFYDSSNTASLQYSGAWTTATQDGVPNATVSASFQQTTEVGASVSFSFIGGTAVAVKGLTGSENGLYSVSLDGSSRSFNATSLWIIPDALLFFSAGLDPTATHHLNITNLSSKLCLNSITVFKYEPRNGKPPEGPDPSGTNSGSQSFVNLGIILGSVIGCLFLVLTGIFIWWYRRRSGHRMSNNFGGLSRKLTFSRPDPKPKFNVAKSATSRSPNPPLSPMLATLNQRSSNFTSNDRSTRDSSSAFNGSDTRSSTNLLNGRRSMPSTISSDADLSRISQMNSVASWERNHDHNATFTSHASRSAFGSGHRAYPSTDSTPSEISAHRSLLQESTLGVPSASSSAAGSSSRQGRTLAPDYIPMSSRKPLPTIPVPSYDAALLAPELIPEDVKDFSTLQFARHQGLDPPYPAPPQYEQRPFS